MSIKADVGQSLRLLKEYFNGVQKSNTKLVVDNKLVINSELSGNIGAALDACFAHRKISMRYAETICKGSGDFTDFMWAFSHIASKSELEKSVSKLEQIVYAIDGGAKVDKQHKLTSREFCNLEKFSFLLSGIDAHIVDALTEKSAFLQLAVKNKSLLQKFEQKYQRALKDPQEDPGDILVQDNDKVTIAFGIRFLPLKPERYVKNGHVRIIETKVADSNTSQKLYGATNKSKGEKIQTQDSLRTMNLLTGDRYAIYPMKLLKTQYAQMLKITNVQEKFREIMSKKLKTAKEYHINAPTPTLIRAFFYSILRKTTAFFSKYVQDDSHRITPLSNYHEGDEIHTTCSGFAAMIIVETLKELDKNLKEMILDAVISERLSEWEKEFKPKNFNSAALKAFKRSEQIKIEDKISKQYPELFEDVPIFNMPFGNIKDLTTILPSELIDLLEKMGALEQLPLPSILSDNITM
ncbi:MAG: hypothetical protein LBI81_01130 [Puniceicoccales bacterium]|nr:hypothetical protein [Puniceicoccales bacterium]